MDEIYKIWVKELYLRNAQSMYQIAYYRVGNEHDAKEVVQDVFLALLSKAEKLYGHEKPDAWLMKALQYSILHKLDQQNRNRKTVLPLDSLAFTLIGDEDVHPTSIDELLSKNISEEDRQILKMYYEQNLSYEEIAAILRIPISTCGTRLRRAKERIKKHIQME